MAAARKIQIKMMVDFVLEKTSSATEDEFIDRFLSSQKITENLKSLQIQADSKLQLLKAEHQELYEAWSIGTLRTVHYFVPCAAFSHFYGSCRLF